MNRVQRFNYEGFEITFNGGDNVLVNATQMARPFNKRPAKWLELPSTQEFLDSLMDIRALNNQEFSSVRLSDTSNSPFVKTIMGSPSSGGGTWMHEDVALEFARWLSPTFAIWCNDRIKELLKYGITGSEDAILDIISNPSNAIKLLEALQKERQEKDRLAYQNKLQSKELKISAPKVEYFNNVLQSNKTYTFTQIAKELDKTSGASLARELNEKGVIYRQSSQWLLKSLYCGNDYTKTRTHTYTDSNGNIGTNSITVWTEKGREFIHSLFK